MLKWKCIVGLLAGLFLTQIYGTGCAIANEKIRVLLPQRNVNEALAPFLAAKYLGYFDQEGLDVEYILVPGSNEVAIQLASGNAEIGWASPAQAVIGMQDGAKSPLDIRYFYNVNYRNIWSITVPTESEIRSVSDLKGKKIGVTALGSAGTNYGKAYLRSAGLNPDTDVTFIPIGAGGQAMAALKQKVVDALVFWETANIQFELSGVDLRTVPIDENLAKLPDVSLLARNETIRNNSKMLIGFARAVAKGIDFSLANRAAGALITWKMYPESKPAEADPEKRLARGVKMTRSILGWVDSETGEKHGLFIAPRWENLSNFLLEGKQITKAVSTSRMYTNDFIDQINQYDRSAIVRQAKGFDLKSIQ